MLNKFTAVALGAALLVAGPAVAFAQAKTSKSSMKPTQLEAPVAGVVAVSDYELNTFVFPEGIKRVLFPAGSPVIGKPIYLSDNTQVMLQFAKGQDKPAQMVVEMESGNVVTLRVSPRALPGVTHNVSGSRARLAINKRTNPDESPVNAAPRGEDIELLKQVISKGEAPAGFDSIKLPSVTRFDKFSVVPLAGWSDGGGKRVLVFSLVSTPGQTAVVSPPQFYRAGITAVIVDGDVVDEKNSPQLYIVEEAQDE